jgi:methylated-DNA-[protein]-cysteine S-methyltransferase
MSALDHRSWIHLPIATELGEFLATYSVHGLAQLRFPSDQRAVTCAPTAIVSTQIQRWHRLTSHAVQRVLTGRPPKDLPPLDLTGGTEFQRRVWRAMTAIPFGRTRSYGEIASRIGKPKAMRAVGAACGANPIPVLVPCHRVLAAHRKIGGFSSGLAWKRALLACEGVGLDR